MNYYNEIKNKLIDNEIYSKVKDYSKERHKVITYFEVGKLLDEAGSKYGDNILNDYSLDWLLSLEKSIMREHWDVLDNIIEYLKMKNGRHWRPNCLGAIILNYYLLKMKMNWYIILILHMKKIYLKEN